MKTRLKENKVKQCKKHHPVGKRNECIESLKAGGKVFEKKK